MLNFFSTRELAHISLFGTLFVLLFIRSKKLRQSTTKLIKFIFEPKTFLIFDLFSLYVILILLPLTYHPLWENYYYKDFVFWILLGGYPTLINNIRTTNKEFRHIIWNQFIYSSFVEYLTGLITFNLLVEYALCILFSFLFIFDAYSKDKGNGIKLYKYIIILAEIILLAITIKTGISNFKEYSSRTTIIKMLIPIFFYVLSIPYIYGFIVYANYEELFCIIGFLEEKKQAPPNRKKDAINWCGINIDRIRVFRNLFSTNSFFTKQDLNDVYNKRKTIEQLTEEWFLEKHGGDII